jgi:ankyrin repeat protein
MCQESGEFVEDNKQMERRMKTLSRGLAEVRTFNNTPVVQFTDQVVKDIFIECGLQVLDSTWRSTDQAIGHAHYFLSRSCLRYITMEEIMLLRTADAGTVSKFPFLRYATTSWVIHSERAEAKHTLQVDLFSHLNWPIKDVLIQWIYVYEVVDEYSHNRPPKGTTLLHIVSRYNLMTLLSAILESLGDGDTEADAKDEYGLTPLSWAAREGHESVVRLLLERGAELDSKSSFDGKTPLSLAAREGHEAVVRLLLERGAELESKDISYGQTPLSWAAGKGHEAVVMLLLERGAELESKDSGYGQTPLSLAAGEGHEAVVRLLLERGAELESKDSFNGQTPLSLAAEKGHEAVVRLLLEHGAELDSRDNSGRTPLSCATRAGHKAVVKLLTRIISDS